MNKRYIVAFIIMFIASVGGSFIAGNQAGQNGARAGKLEVEKEAAHTATHNAYLLAVSQIKLSRKSCESGNDFRVAVNQRTSAIKELAKIIKEFLASAEKARLASASNGGPSADSDRAAAKSYGSLISRLEKIKFTDIKSRDCNKLYPIPREP